MYPVYFSIPSVCDNSVIMLVGFTSTGPKRITMQLFIGD